MNRKQPTKRQIDPEQSSVLEQAEQRSVGECTLRNVAMNEFLQQLYINSDSRGAEQPGAALSRQPDDVKRVHKRRT